MQHYIVLLNINSSIRLSYLKDRTVWDILVIGPLWFNLELHSHSCSSIAHWWRGRGLQPPLSKKPLRNVLNVRFSLWNFSIMATPGAIYAYSTPNISQALVLWVLEQKLTNWKINVIARMRFASQSIQRALMRRWIATADNCYQAIQINMLESLKLLYAPLKNDCWAALSSKNFFLKHANDLAKFLFFRVCWEWISTTYLTQDVKTVEVTWWIRSMYYHSNIVAVLIYKHHIYEKSTFHCTFQLGRFQVSQSNTWNTV